MYFDGLVFRGELSIGAKGVVIGFEAEARSKIIIDEAMQGFQKVDFLRHLRVDRHPEYAFEGHDVGVVDHVVRPLV